MATAVCREGMDAALFFKFVCPAKGKDEWVLGDGVVEVMLKNEKKGKWRRMRVCMCTPGRTRMYKHTCVAGTRVKKEESK